jgi:hypothetical protein
MNPKAQTNKSHKNPKPKTQNQKHPQKKLNPKLKPTNPTKPTKPKTQHQQHKFTTTKQQQQKLQNTHHNNNNNNKCLCNLETRSGGHAGPAHSTISHEIRLFALKKCCLICLLFLGGSF